MRSQRGGFAMGLIVGLLIGLALALAVALYVTKVPVPFVNKVPQRTAEQDAAEIERNKNWDPNAPLAGKPAARAASGTVPALSNPPATAPTPTPAAPVTTAPPGRDPAAILSGQVPAPGAVPAPRPQPTPAADPFLYFVQAGAFTRPDDAEQQRARLAMMGYEAKVTEREQAGKTMYRVRIGPFDRKNDADGAKDKLAGVGVESALVRVQK
ncbi:MAG: SPOR domain-containing protein [Piscinibacter sp.]|nr:SPOR domain-containing protein [Piscinibacter sp.]